MFTTVNGRLILTNTAYDVGKRLVQVVLPAVSSLYFGLAAIWGLPYGEQVVGTLAVIATFLGVCLGISTKHYDESGAPYDGQMVITDTDEGVRSFMLNLDDDPNNLVDRDSVRFKVETPNAPVAKTRSKSKKAKKRTVAD